MRWCAVLLGLALVLPALADPDEVVVQIEARTRRVEVGAKSSRLVGGFSPNFIEVKQGQTVTIELHSVKGTHSIGVSGYEVHTGDVPKGETGRVTFLADRPGEFQLYCRSNCEGLHSRMTGTLWVEPSP